MARDVFFLIQFDSCSELHVECLSILKVIWHVKEVLFVDKESETAFRFLWNCSVNYIPRLVQYMSPTRQSAWHRRVLKEVQIMTCLALMSTAVKCWTRHVMRFLGVGSPLVGEEHCLYMVWQLQAYSHSVPPMSSTRPQDWFTNIYPSCCVQTCLA